MKVDIDFDKEQFSKITGIISDQIASMGEVSDKFIDSALDTAKKYNDEINKQRATIAEIDERLKRGNVDGATRQLLTQTREKSQKILDDYTHGNAEKGLDSKAVVDALANFAQSSREAEGFGKKLSEAGSKAVVGISKFAAGINAAIMVVGQFSEKIKEALKDFSNYANQINPLGAFGSKGQRDVMARYGMSGTQALGFSNTLDAMGMREEQMGNMTSEQRRVFDSLQNFWAEGMGKLDPDALDRFTKTMSDYQEVQAKFQMSTQLMVMKLVTGSPKFSEFVGKVGDLMDSVVEFMGSPVVQWVFDGLVDFLTTVITILEQGMRLISKIPGFGGNGSSIVNNETNTSNNINIFGGSNQSSEELAIKLSHSLDGNYRG